MESITHYADNFIPVILIDYEYHTEKNPFCWDKDCPCHSDVQATERVQQEFEQGLLTAEKAIRTIKGEMV